VVEGDCRVRVTGAELKSNGAPAVVIRGGDHTVITGCSILRTMDSFDAPAVAFEGGRLVLGDNHIEAFGPGVRVGPGAAGGVIRGNLIDAHGSEAVECDPAVAGKVMVEGNLEQSTGDGAQ